MKIAKTNCLLWWYHTLCLSFKYNNTGLHFEYEIRINVGKNTIARPIKSVGYKYKTKSQESI